MIASADEKALCQMFCGITDNERGALAKTAIRVYNSLLGTRERNGGPLNALLVSANTNQLKKLDFPWIKPGDLYFDLLDQEKPITFQGWVESRIAKKEIDIELMDDLVARSLCRVPDSDEYVLTLLGKIRGDTLYSPLVAHLKQQTVFLQNYVWRLFEIEGNEQISLASMDKLSPSSESFEHALLELSRDSLLSRERLLDASLSALERDFHSSRGRWFLHFHEALEPTLTERRNRVASYFNLVTSAIPSTVTFAINTLLQLAKDEALPAELLTKHLNTVMLARPKVCVEAALSLLKLTIESDPDSAVPLCSMATQAFVHESPEIQRKAAKLIIDFAPRGNELLETELARYRESMTPSVRKRLHDWTREEKVSVDSQNSFAGVPLAISIGDQGYVEEPRQTDNTLETATRLELYNTIEDVIAGCSYSLEHPDDAVRFDLALEGIVRFFANVPEDIELRIAPLKQRALTISGSSAQPSSFMQQQLASFIICWLTNNPCLPYRNSFQVSGEEYTFQVASQEFMYERMARLIERIVQKNSLPVLSTLTHDHGWIDPAVVASRWQKYVDAGREPDDYDQATCFLRLPLSHLGKLLPEYIELKGNFWDAVRYSTGYSNVPPNVPCAGSRLWQAASYFRNSNSPYFNLGEGTLYQYSSDLNFIRTLGLFFSTMQNRFVASGIRTAGTAIDELVFGVRPYIEVLLEPTFNFDQPAYHFLAASLINFDPECASLARDVVIQLIDTRRLSTENLGREIGVFLYCGRSKTKRLVLGLSDIARVSVCHSSAVRQLLERALQGGEMVPRDLFTVVELLNELLHAEGKTLANVTTKEYLRSLRIGGKAGKIIRELVSG